MRQPVITPSGITYERVHILKHLTVKIPQNLLLPDEYFKKKQKRLTRILKYFHEQITHTDPISREVLHSDQLRPNTALKEALEDFTAMQP